MEWVYNGSSDEPTIFEGDSHGSSTQPAPFDIFLSSSAVEDEPRSECEAEAEYYGSSDEPDELLPPEQAFLKFGQRFASLPTADFSVSIHPHVTVQSHVPRRLPARNPAAESRTERFARIAAELEALAAEAGVNSDQQSDSLADLSALREQLRSIEVATAVSHQQPRMQLLQQKETSDQGEGTGAHKGVTVRLVSPDLGAVTALERRVAALENSVGISHFTEACDGTKLARMLDDVHNRLELMTDHDLPERLKNDAKEIAEILQKELQSEHGADVVNAATVLEKMEKWEHLANVVPLVVERLRCFKRLQDEAGQFVTSLATLGKQIDSLSKRSETADKLISNVHSNLEANCKAVQENLDILDRKFTETAQTYS